MLLQVPTQAQRQMPHPPPSTLHRPVCEWCDHEPPRVPQVLIRVVKAGVGLAHAAVILLPVEAELAQPLKRIACVAAHSEELVDDVSSVHLNGDQGHNLGPLHLGQLPTNSLRELVQHCHLFLLEAAQCLLVTAVEGLLAVSSPLDLTGCDTQLGREREEEEERERRRKGEEGREPNTVYIGSYTWLKT